MLSRFSVKKFFAIILVFALVLSFGTTSLAVTQVPGNGKTQIVSNLDSELERVNQYLHELGYSDIPLSAVNIMMQTFSVGNGISDWDVLVDYIVSGKIPEGFNVIIEKESVEISSKNTDLTTLIRQDRSVIQPMSTITVFSKGYEPCYQSLTVFNGTRGAYTGHCYYIARFRTGTGNAVGISVQSPANGVAISKTLYTAVSGQVISASGTVCDNPVAGKWTMRITCQDSKGAYLYGALMCQS